MKQIFFFYNYSKILGMVRKLSVVQKVGCVVSSISKLQKHEGFTQPWKLWPNLCSLRWLRPKQRRGNNFKPIGSKILNILLWFGWMKDNNLLLNIEIDFECLMLLSNQNQSFKVEGKKNTWNSPFDNCKLEKLLFLVLMAALHFGIKL